MTPESKLEKRVSGFELWATRAFIILLVGCVIAMILLTFATNYTRY